MEVVDDEIGVVVTGEIEVTDLGVDGEDGDS